MLSEQEEALVQILMDGRIAPDTATSLYSTPLPRADLGREP